MKAVLLTAAFVLTVSVWGSFIYIFVTDDSTLNVSSQPARDFNSADRETDFVLKNQSSIADEEPSSGEESRSDEGRAQDNEVEPGDAIGYGDGVSIEVLLADAD
ncbi:hypothetical protein [Salisediminibacterium halotolerans]|uniref:Uncharacterized protein n=1 Tax=Salisediminibacterium halotolerans TaxID=517425 RepID=A0A1H9NX57_9BACI|nr:hypothetical protein [Salisediminibacterium haloalkalitolerans]SER40520.1 hypothetical protein SAMN05444126_1017 [Salisediminibacterium haloalkalitolerans]